MVLKHICIVGMSVIQLLILLLLIHLLGFSYKVRDYLCGSEHTNKKLHKSRTTFGKTSHIEQSWAFLNFQSKRTLKQSRRTSSRNFVSKLDCHRSMNKIQSNKSKNNKNKR